MKNGLLGRRGESGKKNEFLMRIKVEGEENKKFFVALGSQGRGLGIREGGKGRVGVAPMSVEDWTQKHRLMSQGTVKEVQDQRISLLQGREVRGCGSCTKKTRGGRLGLIAFLYKQLRRQIQSWQRGRGDHSESRTAKCESEMEFQRTSVPECGTPKEKRRRWGRGPRPAGKTRGSSGGAINSSTRSPFNASGGREKNEKKKKGTKSSGAKTDGEELNC